MAFNRLRDIRDRMESKWTSGQFVFGYEDDINELHNIDYPLLLVIPPTSTLPATEKAPINAHLKEEYEFQYQLAAGEDADRVSVRFVPFSSLYVEG